MESELVTRQAVPSSHERRIPELDGVRAFAILSVMVGHLLVTTPLIYHTSSGLPGPLRTLLNHGWLGVDLFFVLSGFLITSILLASRSNGVSTYYGRFYERRALRILPLYLLMLAIMTVAYWPAGHAYFLLSLVFSANLAGLLHIHGPNGGGPLWSLAVEEQFYLVWPVLVLLLDRRKLAIVLVAMLCIEPVLRAVFYPDFNSTWVRSDGLAMGALLALWFSSARHNRAADDRLALGLLGVGVAIAVAALPFGGLENGPTSHSLRIPEALCLFGALMVFGISRSGSRATAFLRVPFALLTADFSYCLYLVHVPLIDAYETFLHRAFPQLATALGPLDANLLRAAVVITLAYGLAALSRRFIELPFLNIGRRRQRARRAEPVSASS